jgi:hypothetical protein
MGQAIRKVIAVTLDKKLRLIIRPRSYRIQQIGNISQYKTVVKKGWVDVRKIPRNKGGDEFTTAVSAFNRVCVERKSK